MRAKKKYGQTSQESWSQKSQKIRNTQEMASLKRKVAQQDRVLSDVEKFFNEIASDIPLEKMSQMYQLEALIKDSRGKR